MSEPVAPGGSWVRVYEKGALCEARALPGSFMWEGREFKRGDLMVRRPGGDVPGVFTLDEFAARFLQAPEDRDHEAQLKVMLYGFMQACDRVLVERGTPPDSKVVARMVSDLLGRFRKRETSVPLVMRTLANALLSVYVAQDMDRRRTERDPVEPGEAPEPGTPEEKGVS